MDRAKFDWRIQATSQLASYVPAAYPGGPSHPIGSNVVLSSVSKIKGGTKISYHTPSAVALALSIAINSAKTAIQIKPTQSGSVPAPSGPTNLLFDYVSLYDYLEQCFISVTFSFQAIEAFANYKIAYNLKDKFEFTKDDKNELLNKEEVERRFSTDDKIDFVLPKILSISSLKGRRPWELFINLKRVRDSTIHLKSHHQWTTNDKYDDSPYTIFLKESPLQFSIDALTVIRCFSGDAEKPWLDGADKLISDELARQTSLQGKYSRVE